MFITKCDRCGNESRHENDEMPLITYKYHREDDKEYVVDLCPVCLKEFKDSFMGGIKDGNE